MLIRDLTTHTAGSGYPTGGVQLPTGSAGNDSSPNSNTTAAGGGGSLDGGAANLTCKYDCFYLPAKSLDHPPLYLNVLGRICFFVYQASTNGSSDTSSYPTSGSPDVSLSSNATGGGSASTNSSGGGGGGKIPFPDNSRVDASAGLGASSGSSAGGNSTSASSLPFFDVSGFGDCKGKSS